MKSKRLLMIPALLLLGVTPPAGGAAWRPAEARALAGAVTPAPPPAQAKRRARRTTRRRTARKTERRASAFSKDLGALRAQFNRDNGEVRLVLLLSPT